MSRKIAMNYSKTESFHIFGRKFNVTKAKKLIEKRERRTNPIDVENATELFPMVNISKRRALGKKINLDVPLIVASLEDDEGEQYLPIDGWHRLYKASKEGIRSLPAYVLSEEETKEVLSEE